MMKTVWATLTIVAGAVLGFQRVLAQYGSSGSSSYSSSPSSSSYAASPAMQSSSSSNTLYPAVNLPLLSFPATQGNATVGTSSSSNSTGTSSTGTNYLSSLPSSAITNLSPYTYAFGTYANDYDASRDYYYNHSDFYVFNQYTTNLTGYGALNLSNPVAVAAANWWSPYPYQLAAWNDGYTTQGPSSTTSSSVTGAVVLNASAYYAAYGGNVAGLGIPGLGLSVPGPAPNVSLIQPGLNYAYNVQASVASSPAAYAASYSSPASSSYGGSSSAYGR